MIRFRPAHRREVPDVVALLGDDILGQSREVDDMKTYLDAFDQMTAEAANHLIVGLDDAEKIVATYQLTFISGLSLSATRRAQVESVRVARHLRGQGTGQQMFEDVKTRARAAGCGLIQLTMNTTRKDAKRFYESLGFEASHTGFKLYLA